MKLNKFILFIIVFFSSFFIKVSAQVRILTIGDSTMANYDEEKNSGEKEMRGWAQMFPVFTKDNVRVDNAAKNGRSSKSFYLEFWKELRETLKPGDYVFIQFGHNDEKNKGLDDEIGNPKQRGTAAWGQYQDFLTIYINESRERGAIPILFTPVVRRLFNEDNIISGVGLHNLSDIAGNDSLMNYPLAMKALAEKLNVPLIDMTTLTQNLVEGYGAEKAKKVIYANNDNTHLKAMGGILFSRLAAEELLKQNILTDYLTIASGISIKPNKYDFGELFLHYSKVKTLQITGMDLEPASGSIYLGVTSPFSFATDDNKNFSPSREIFYTNGNINIPVYVKFEPKKEHRYSTEINILVNDKSLAPIQLSGRGMSIKGGKPLTITYEPFIDRCGSEENSTVACRYSFKEMTATSYKDGVIYSIEDKKWPAGDIDLNTGRYLEFSVKVEKNNYYISNVDIEMGSIGGKGMVATVLGSTDSGFTNPTTFMIMENLVNDTTKEYSFDSFLKISKGETFYLRIYPWFKTEATDKSLLINSIEIRGMSIKK